MSWVFLPCIFSLPGFWHQILKSYKSDGVMKENGSNRLPQNNKYGSMRACSDRVPDHSAQDRSRGWTNVRSNSNVRPAVPAMARIRVVVAEHEGA